MGNEKEKQSEVKVDLKKQSNGVWNIEVEGCDKPTPIFHWREDSHKKLIAELIARGKVGVVFGVGNYGMVKAVADPRRGRSYDSGERFFTEKIGRQVYSKIPIYAHPKFWSQYLDRRKIHPEFRNLFTYENLKKFYEQITICHIVAPTYDVIPSLDPIFITTLADWVAAGKPAELWVRQNTASFFWWNDPDGEEIADLVYRFDSTLTIGISSFNDHREKPAFSVEDVINYIRFKKRVPFDFVVRDEIGEAIGVRSSHPQFKVPLVGEEPVWTVVRKGSVSVDKFLQATGLPFGARSTEATTMAARDHPDDINLDRLVDQVSARVRENWLLRRRTGKILRFAS